MVKHNAFIPYETDADPVTHTQHYGQAMFMHEEDDDVTCKIFPSSLEKVDLTWFHKLEPNSIRSWKQLSEEFIGWFLTS